MCHDRVKLGPRLDGSPRPAFISRVGLRGLLVELDSSAVSKLVPANRISQLDGILDAARPQIAAAAQRLFAQSKWETADELVITVTALDL